MIPPDDEFYGPDSFGGDDSESHYAAPALWQEVRREKREKLERVHELKLSDDLFAVVASGIKTFELRRNDRDFRVGDVLVLRAWDGTSYTGKSCRVEVTYMLDGQRFGALQPEFVCLAIRLLGEPQS